MTEEPTSTIEPVFLENSLILPFEGEYPFALHGHDLTRDLGYIATEQLDQAFDNYEIFASASIHRASIAYRKPGLEIERKEGILYDGNIQIYGQKKIWTHVGPQDKPQGGYGLLRAGGIWAAVTNGDEPSLRELVFGEVLGEPGVDPKRIEKILLGYERQDEATREAETNRDRETFSLGQRDRGNRFG